MGHIEIFKLFGSILVDNDEANKSISKTGKESDGLVRKMGRGIKTAGKWALGITTAAIGIGTAAFAMTKKVTGAFDDIAKNSRKMGVSTDYYQEMEYWASQNGLSHENMEKSMKRLNQRLGQAVEGNEKYSNALTRLGVDLEEVEKGNVSTEQAMTQSIQALSEMENSQEKAALATELFGTKLAQELMPAIDGGALSIEDAQKKAKELGIVIAEDTLNAAEEFNDTWDDLTRSMSAFGQNVIARLMPAFQSLMDWVIDHMPQIQEVFQAVFDVIGIVFSTATERIQSLIAWLGEFKESNSETFNSIWETIQEVFNNVLEFWVEVWQFISDFWEEYGQSLLESFINIFQGIYEVVRFAFDTVWEIISTILGLIMPFIKDTLEKIFSFWDDNGKKIMDAVDNAFSFVMGVIDFVMPIIIAIVEGAWDIITAVFDTSIGIIMGLVDFFASLLTGDFEGMKDALTDIWNSLWDGIKGVVDGAWNLLSGAFSALWDSISGWFTGLKDDAVDWGKNMISGFIDGIKGMAGDVGDAAKGVVSGIGDFLKFWSPAKKGEGRYIRHWGRNMIDGFLDGVEDEESAAGKAMENVVKKMNPSTLSIDAMSNISRRGLVHTSPSATQSLALNIAGIERLLVELIQVVREGKVINMDNRIVGETIEPVVTEVQKRNKKERDDFA